MLQSNDLFIVERGGVQFQMTADQIAEFVGAVNDYTAADISERDSLTGLKVGDRVFVSDATADSTVNSGWAVYRAQSIGPIVYEKIQEQESLDVSVSGSNLGYTPSAGQGTITNSGGDDAVIPLADATNAGLASPAMFNNSHVAATSGLTSATNPVNVSGSQSITFSVTQLDPLP